MSTPPMDSVPLVSLFRPTTALPMVDLPDPDSPTSPTTSPISMSKLTPSTARNTGRPGYSMTPSTMLSARVSAAWPGAAILPAATASILLPRCGTEASNCCVYGCDALLKIFSARSVSTMSPSFITAIRSAISATTPISCVISTMEASMRFRRSRIRSRISACTVTSRAVVGSSAISRDGSDESACAIIAR